MSFSAKYYDVIDLFDCKHLHQEFRRNGTISYEVLHKCSLNTNEWLMCENGMSPRVPLRNKGNLEPRLQSNTLNPFRALLQKIW